MRSSVRHQPTPTRDLVRATLLLVGLAAVGYGYFEGRGLVLFVGLLVIVANVLSGVVDIVTATGRRARR